MKKLPAGISSSIPTIPYLLSFALAFKIQHLEMTFIRLLHLLAHHPDFSTSPEDMMDIAKFV